MTYFLLLLSGALFALQFCTNKYFQMYKPEGETPSVIYSLLGKAAAAVVFAACICFARAPFFGNGYTLLTGAIQAALNLVLMLVGIKVLAIGSVSLYTVFLTMGGMAVPAVFGVCFLGDEFRLIRLFAFILIAAAVVLSGGSERKKLTKKAIVFYAILFFGNGFYGVFTALHSNVWGREVTDFTYMFTASWIASLCYLPVAAALYAREKRAGILGGAGILNCAAPPLLTDAKPAAKIFYKLSSCIGGILNGVGNLLIVMCTATDGIGSAVTFPLMTGGTILFAALFSALFYKEKISLAKWLSIALIIIALVLFIL